MEIMDIRILHQRFQEYLARSFSALRGTLGITVLEMPAVANDLGLFQAFWKHVQADPRRLRVWSLRLSEGGFEAETAMLDTALKAMPTLQKTRRLAA